jgi:hypothetical protein
LIYDHSFFPYSFLFYSTRAEYRPEGIQRDIATQLEVSSKSLGV